MESIKRSDIKEHAGLLNKSNMARMCKMLYCFGKNGIMPLPMAIL